MANGNAQNKSSGFSAHLGFADTVRFIREVFGKGNDFAEQTRDLLLPRLLSGQVNVV